MLDLNNPATLKLGVDEQGGRFVAGETASVTITVKGCLPMRRWPVRGSTRS